MVMRRSPVEEVSDGFSVDGSLYDLSDSDLLQ